MVVMSNGHQYRFTHRAPREAGARTAQALVAGGAFFLDIVNFMNFAACQALPPLSLRAA
jgi:hypothetical protein